MNRVHDYILCLHNVLIGTQMKNVLSGVDGVSMVNADKMRGSAEVGSGKPAAKDEIRLEIERTGCKTTDLERINWMVL